MTIGSIEMGDPVSSAVRVLKKGELLFQEGDQSRAMYLVKSGMIRLFMKKGSSFVEMDTIRSGQVLGELSFLDGQARSASGEALMESEVVEISGEVLFTTLEQTPEWLKALLKTVVGRLRAANTKVRQLEASQTVLKYESRGSPGKIAGSYEFITYLEFLKVALSVLLVAHRSSSQEEAEGVELDLTLINQYAHWIMGIATAKIACVMDLLAQADMLTTKQVNKNDHQYLKNKKYLEEVTEFFYSDDLFGSHKKQGVSVRGLELMLWIAKEIQLEPSGLIPNAEGVVTVNLVSIREKSLKEADFSVFKVEDSAELERAGYLMSVKTLSKTEVMASLKPQEFLKHYRNMQILVGIHRLNEQKQSVQKAA